MQDIKPQDAQHTTESDSAEDTLLNDSYGYPKKGYIVEKTLIRIPLLRKLVLPYKTQLFYRDIYSQIIIWSIEMGIILGYSIFLLAVCNIKQNEEVYEFTKRISTYQHVGWLACFLTILPSVIFIYIFIKIEEISKDIERVKFTIIITKLLFFFLIMFLWYYMAMGDVSVSFSAVIYHIKGICNPVGQNVLFFLLICGPFSIIATKAMMNLENYEERYVEEHSSHITLRGIVKSMLFLTTWTIIFFNIIMNIIVIIKSDNIGVLQIMNKEQYL
ncbi:hypothetical protein NEFER03_1019 [Nematocida sp. LUAm3]|nr:hypothetical protein NEFER03_1019 [Nematocida sp. LUAm3]KAI5175377.1 hypothetical protein NEFER02_1306 [Nematocida sp. LUAm2]KAI5177666.1 hypothetical protein NEFER01_0890 [Nematocida sp. LUAm1]